MELESGASPSTGMIGFLAWVEVNKKRLLIGGGAALVALFLGILFMQHQAQKEATASQALSDIRVPFSAAGVVAPGTADTLLTFANEHRGTKAGGRALLLSAGLLFTEHTPNGYAEAQKRFARHLQEYPTSPWVAEANLGVAKALLAQGKTNEALGKFEEVQKRFANSGILDEVKLELARLYETAKPEDAFRLYDELARSGMGGALAMEANMRQEELLKQQPQLAKLREKIAPTPTPPPQTITLSNRLTAASNAVAAGTNFQRITITNRAGATSAPMQIQLTPTPGAPNTPGAPGPAGAPAATAPAPTTAPAPAPAPAPKP